MDKKISKLVLSSILSLGLLAFAYPVYGDTSVIPQSSEIADRGRGHHGGGHHGSWNRHHGDWNRGWYGGGSYYGYPSYYYYNQDGYYNSSPYYYYDTTPGLYFQFGF